MNVALTRCCKGMVVVTDKRFLQGAGRSTLLGQLCHTWSRHHQACWIDSNTMLNNSGALPGLPGPGPSRPNGMQSHSHNHSVRTTMPPHNPPFQTQTWTRTNPEPLLDLIIRVMGPSNPNYQRGRGGGAVGGSGSYWRSSAQSAGAATAVRRNLDDNEFPSLQPLATALDPTLSSRQRSWGGRR